MSICSIPSSTYKFVREWSKLNYEKILKNYPLHELTYRIAEEWENLDWKRFLKSW